MNGFPVICALSSDQCFVESPGSDTATGAGRNADFFMFSSCFVGSEGDGLCADPQFETTEPNLDLATAMAISGAAVSSNMGSQSVRPLPPYADAAECPAGHWIKNPRFVWSGERNASEWFSIRQRLTIAHAITTVPVVGNYRPAL